MAITKKADLVSKIAHRLQITQKEATDGVNALLDSISKELVNGNEVTLTGFGTFKAKQSAARTGRNPRTGEQISIPSKVQPSFKASKTLKDALNADN